MKRARSLLLSALLLAVATSLAAEPDDHRHAVRIGLMVEKASYSSEQFPFLFHDLILSGRNSLHLLPTIYGADPSDSQPISLSLGYDHRINPTLQLRFDLSYRQLEDKDLSGAALRPRVEPCQWSALFTAAARLSSAEPEHRGAFDRLFDAWLHSAHADPAVARCAG